ncbi:sensor histidine kinase [Clostridiales bacterium COT073_COT-073]|nr:sensor histidine kinase [Clostridiales bacterium COT073_COT-073]
MKIKYYFSKINIQIALTFFVISLLLVSLLSAIVYYSAVQIMKDSMKKQTEDAVVQASEYIASYLDKIKTLSDLIAMHPETQAALHQEEKKAIESLAGMVNLSAASDPRIQSIAVISRNGFALTSDNNMVIPLSADMMNESWYQRAVASKQMPVITSIRHGEFNRQKSSWVIAISHEITGKAGEHLGVVLIDVSYKFIEDYISSLELGKAGYAYILDENNQILYHPDESILMDKMKADELLALAQEMKSVPKDRIVTKSAIPHSHWTLVGISSLEQVEALQNRLISTIIWINALLLAVSLIISYAISRRLSGPIVELQRAMKEVDENWGHLHPGNRAYAEIKELAAEYNALLDRIKLLTEDIAQKENAKRVFELKALQSQINPHFLYNTLDTILWLAEFGENEKVVEVSKALGEMLRLSLSIHQDRVPLEQELLHTENYLKIQQQRYVDKISYSISGQEDLLEAEVPKLILQPIVENSIYHGIRPQKKMGQINIGYQREDDLLIITVADDGLGYHPQKQEKDSNLIKTKLGGIGMKNVDQRIKILCGEEYGITIENQENGGAIVTYRLPLSL